MVTGGAGFIGSSLVNRLLELGIVLVFMTTLMSFIQEKKTILRDMLIIKISDFIDLMF